MEPMICIVDFTLPK